MVRFRNSLMLGCAIMSDTGTVGGASGGGTETAQPAAEPAAAASSTSNGWATAEQVIQDILTVGTTVASLLPGTSSVVNAIQLAVQIGNGIANDIPEIQQVWQEMQATSSGGAAPTAEQWAAWNAAADTAHAQFMADVAAAEKVAGG